MKRQFPRAAGVTSPTRSVLTSCSRSVISVLPGLLRIDCLVRLFVLRGQLVDTNSLLEMFAAYMVRSFGCPRRWYQTFAPTAAATVAGIVGVLITIAISSPVVGGVAKDVVAEKAVAVIWCHH